MVDQEVLSRDHDLSRRQIFDTRSRALAEEVEKSFTRLCRSAGISHSTGDDLGLVDKDEEERRRSRLPRDASPLLSPVSVVYTLFALCLSSDALSAPAAQLR